MVCVCSDVCSRKRCSSEMGRSDRGLLGGERWTGVCSITGLLSMGSKPVARSRTTSPAGSRDQHSSLAQSRVEADDGSRAGELDRLLPLVRFPMMASTEAAAAEPLFMQHPLALQLMMECHPGYHAAADCRRLRPRKGRRDPRAPPDPDWMETTDGFNGFKKLHHFPNVALAVSKTCKMEAGKVYGAPAG